MPAYETIPEVTSLTPGGTLQEFEDASSHSTVGGYREYLPTWKDNEDLTFECIYIPSNGIHQGIHADADAGTKRNWKVLFKNAAGSTIRTFTFEAYVMRFNPTANFDGVYRASGALKITGAITRS